MSKNHFLYGVDTRVGIPILPHKEHPNFKIYNSQKNHSFVSLTFKAGVSDRKKEDNYRCKKLTRDSSILTDIS